MLQTIGYNNTSCYDSSCWFCSKAYCGDGFAASVEGGREAVREEEERDIAAATVEFVGPDTERGIGALVVEEGGELGRMLFMEVDREGEVAVEGVAGFTVDVVRAKEEGSVILEDDFDIRLEEDLDNGLPLFLLLALPELVVRVRPIAEGDRVKTGGSRLLPFLARDW